MTHPYRRNNRFVPETSVLYTLSAGEPFVEWGMKKTDLVLVTPIGGYCVGPDGNAWWVPFGPSQADGTDEPDSSGSYLQWDIARNAREEDFAVFPQDVPFEVEYAGLVVAYALSEMTEMVLSGVSTEKARESAMFWMSTVDWNVTGEAYA